jgi:hypothetical protein
MSRRSTIPIADRILIFTLNSGGRLSGTRRNLWRNHVGHKSWSAASLARPKEVVTDGVLIDLRRGIDLLLARNDVDATRLAYIGHSYGAQWGSILTAVDKRMKTSILMAGVAQFGDVYLRTSDPGLTDFRKTQPAGQLEKYCEVLGQVDAIHFVGNAAPIPILLQFANYEQYFDKASMQHYISTASDPKKVLFYDTGHDLNDFQALEDRYEWLVNQIHLRREPILQETK